MYRSSPENGLLNTNIETLNDLIMGWINIQFNAGILIILAK